MEGVVGVGSEFLGDGTDYETSLRAAMDILADADGFRNRDVVFITDDYRDVSDAFLREYHAEKRGTRFSTYSVVGARGECPQTLRKLSDEVISAGVLTEGVALELSWRARGGEAGLRPVPPFGPAAVLGAGHMPPHSGGWLQMI
jgi:uncharacterized protein with von Willebrand factor type A (vWA) domain